MNQRQNRKTRRIVLAATCALSGAAPVASADPFYIGGDVSLLPFIEQQGGVFRENSQSAAAPMDKIAVDHGANLFRLRLFVNPNPNYSATQGAIQDLNYTIALAQRLKARGAKILLDFHYSDSWADPGKQNKPAAWSSLSFGSLTTQVHDYTRDSLVAFKDAGVMPEMVQVGNEITNGMLWNDGKVVYTGTQQQQNQSWQNFGTFLNAAISGVRDVDALTAGQHTDIAIHVDGGNVNGRAQYYFNQIINVAGVSASSFDTMGMSFYPSNNGTTSFNNLKDNLNYLATHYNQKVMVLEVNKKWKGASDGTQWAVSPTGQLQMLTDVRDAVLNLPNNKGQGVVWWYPEAVQVPGQNIWQGGAIAMFDDDSDGNGTADAHEALAVLNALNAWRVDSSGTWSNAANWITMTPSGTDTAANFTSRITAPRTVTIDGARTVGRMYFENANSYTLGGSGTLTLDVSSGNAGITVANGSHTISVPLNLSDDTTITVTPVGSTLTVSGELTTNNHAITKSGLGAARFSNIRGGALNIGASAGTVTILSNGADSGASKLTALSIGTSAALDLNNNDLIVGNATSMSAVQALVANAAHFTGALAAWDRTGITSSAARSDSRTNLAVVSGAEYLSASANAGTTLFAGLPFAADDTLIKYTWNGDTDVNGVINFDDYQRLDGAFQTQSTGAFPLDWFHGNFNYDGIIGFDDYALIDAAFQTQSGTLRRAIEWITGDNRASTELAEVSEADMDDPALRLIVQHFDEFGQPYADAFIAAVPEPTSALVLSGVVTFVTLSVRRRKRTVAKLKV